MGKMGTRNSRPMPEAPPTSGTDAVVDIETSQSQRENGSSSCENSWDGSGSNRGSLLRVFRGRKSKKFCHGSNGVISDEGSVESSFSFSGDQSGGIDGLITKTKFTRAELQRMYRGFKNDCPKGFVDRETFKKIYAQFFPRVESEKYAGLVFNAFDLNRRGKLSYETFIIRLSMALHGTAEDKLKWMFHLYDADGDGVISKEDLNVVVSAVHNLIGSRPEDSAAIKKQILDKSDNGFVTQDVFIGNCKNDECISQSLAVFDTKR